jgi:hypothetical protein
VATASWVFTVEEGARRRVDRSGAGGGEACIGEASQLPDPYEDKLQSMGFVDENQDGGVRPVERGGTG